MSGICCVVWDVEEEWSAEIDHTSDALIVGLSLDESERFMVRLKVVGNIFRFHDVKRGSGGLLLRQERLKNGQLKYVYRRAQLSW